jgi:PAS domain S-box-containing protein
MSLLRNHRLLTKINLTIAVILLMFFALSAWLGYRQQRAFILEDAVEKARLVASQAIRTREYLSAQLQIGGIDLSEQRYGMIPVVASNRIGLRVAEDLDYRIRQVSERYRNASNAPDPFESLTLKRFRETPALDEYFAITTDEGEPVFRYLQPFTAEESCLECHGDPKNAPDFLQRLYPLAKDQAYHYQIGEIIGAASVTIPMDRLYRQIMANVRHDILYTGGVFLALITCLGLLIRVVVTRPLARFGTVIGEVVRTGQFEEKLPRRGGDEIGVLIDGFNEMIDHLREKTRHLEESEKRYRVLTETARDGIISFLANGQIILFNHEAERMFGYSKAEVLGLGVDRLIHEDFAEIHRLGVQAYLKEKGGAAVNKLNRLPGRRRDGTVLPLEFSLSVAESEGHLFYTAIVRIQG